MRISDWSSDVCSSVLREGGIAREELHLEGRVREFAPVAHVEIALQAVGDVGDRALQIIAPGYRSGQPGDVARIVGPALRLDDRSRDRLRRLGIFRHPVGSHGEALFGMVHPHLAGRHGGIAKRSEEHTSELQSLMRTSYAVFCLKKKTLPTPQNLRVIDRTPVTTTHI